MEVAALVISIVSALTAGVSVYITYRWRREAQLTAAKLIRALVSRKQVYVDTELTTWDPVGIHNSVYELRDELARALVGLPISKFEIGQGMVERCTSYLWYLRRYTHVEPQKPLDEALRKAHEEWRASLDVSMSQLVPSARSMNVP